MEYCNFDECIMMLSNTFKYFCLIYTSDKALKCYERQEITFTGHHRSRVPPIYDAYMISQEHTTLEANLILYSNTKMSFSY